MVHANDANAEDCCYCAVSSIASSLEDIDSNLAAYRALGCYSTKLVVSRIKQSPGDIELRGLLVWLESSGQLREQ